MKSNEISAMEDPDYSRSTEGTFWAKEAAEGKKQTTDHFRHEAYCAAVGGGDNDDYCKCSRTHIRKENKRLGLPTSLPDNTWRKASTLSGSGDPYANVFQIYDNVDSMDALRAVFPDGEANPEDWVLFSTSGTHGTYATIEDVEAEVNENGFSFDGLTFIIIHPRSICMKYGRAYPETSDDFAFLKRLRESSIKAVSEIGYHK
jgi:hypothetical protein